MKTVFRILGLLLLVTSGVALLAAAERTYRIAVIPKGASGPGAEGG